MREFLKKTANGRTLLAQIKSKPHMVYVHEELIKLDGYKDRRCEDCRHFSEKKSLSEQGYVISSLESKCLRCFRYPVPEWVDNWERIKEKINETSTVD